MDLTVTEGMRVDMDFVEYMHSIHFVLFQKVEGIM